MAGPDEEFELESCRACRGSGKVVSNLGGKSRQVDCPWCEGNGRFIAEHNAQARWGGSGSEAGRSGGEKASKEALDA